jgi:serine phosphatase RsbU (regulator of sigma subunit)
VCYVPAALDQPIGGDWYDVFPLSSTVLCAVIGDVAGHGPEAAAFMVQMRNVVRAMAAELRAPDEILSRATEVTRRVNPDQELFITCCVAIVDVSNQRFSWSCAGHLPPLLSTRDGELRFGVGDVGPPLLTFRDAEYRTTSVPFRPGDRAVLFTDGLVERPGGDIDIELERLRRSARDFARYPAQGLVDELAGRVESQVDDLAIICIDRK